MKVSKKYPPSLFKFDSETKMGDWIEKFTRGRYKSNLLKTSDDLGIYYDVWGRPHCLAKDEHFRGTVGDRDLLFELRYKSCKNENIILLGEFANNYQYQIIYKLSKNYLRFWMKEHFRELIKGGKK